MESFGTRLQRAIDNNGQICVGVDPHPALLQSWGLADSGPGLREFGLRIVEAAAGRVAAIKPQLAFFERQASAGIQALEAVLAAAKMANLLVIMDAKRGDIGSTMDGYAQAFLGNDSPLAGDAVTLSPFLGFGSLQPAVALAKETGRGVFVLALTSNPQGREVQHATLAGTAVAASIVQQARAANLPGEEGTLGSVGLVIGATTGPAWQHLGLDLEGFQGAILAPGFGAQGAGKAELDSVFSQVKAQVLPTLSRSILERGPSVTDLQNAIIQAKSQLF